MMACEIDFVTVVNMEMKIEQGYNIKIKPYWRELPHEKGFTLLEDKIYETCGIYPGEIRSHGAVVKSLDFIKSGDILYIDQSSEVKFSGVKTCDWKSFRKSLLLVYKQLKIPMEEHVPAANEENFTMPLVTKVSELEQTTDNLMSSVEKCLSKLQELSDDVANDKKEFNLQFSEINLRMGSISDRCSLMEQKLERQSVTPNLIKNSLMADSCGSPLGFTINTSWKPGGKIETMAVHPYTQGFEGCYSEDAPPGSLTPNQCAIADKDHPVFYGSYYMGPRLSRGGLSSGWQTIGKGNILKLSGRRIKQFETAVNLPVMRMGSATNVRVMAWIKCVKGSVAFSFYYPYFEDPGQLVRADKCEGRCRAEDCVDQPQGWYRMDDVISMRSITKLNGGQSFMLRCFGPTETEGLGDFEIYVALPYASLVEDPNYITVAPFPSEW